jgi:hypothetical protein
MISTDVSGGNWSHIYWGLNVNIFGLVDLIKTMSPHKSGVCAAFSKFILDPTTY